MAHLGDDLAPYLLSKAVIEESFIFEAGRVYGIYELKGGEWQYTESDEKLSFIFPCDGEEVVATISGSVHHNMLFARSGQKLTILERFVRRICEPEGPVENTED